MNMIERVARAIAKERHGHTEDTFPGLPRAIRADLHLEARAAIEAMMEPTERMEDAGWEQLPNSPDDWSPVSAYTRMIQAALEEQ